MTLWNRYANWLVFIVALFICTSFIGLYPIYILDEARNAEAAREMYVTGNYVVPFFNGELRTDKPPLHYYFMCFGYQLFGINAFGARFFSGVFGAFTLLMGFVHTKKWIGRDEAAITTTLLLSSLFFVQEFHLAVPDPYLIFFITASLFCFFEFYQSRKYKWLLFAYGSIGLGLLTKGPIAMAIPGMTMVAFLALKQDFKLKTIFSFRPILGILLALSIALPWYYLVHVATEGAWTEGFFLNHNINRFHSGKEGHGGIFLVTPLFVLLGLLPFSVVIVQSFMNGWKNRTTNDLLLFAFASASVTLVFFSIASTKLPNYPMPCYPFVAILLAVYLKQIQNQKILSRALKWSLVFLIFLSMALPVAGFLALSLETQFYEVRWVSLFLLIVTVGGISCWVYYKRGDLKKSFLSIAFSWILMGLTLFGVIYPVLTRQSPVYLASKIVGKNDNVVVFQRFDSAFPINFNRTFLVVQTLKEVEEYLNEHPDAYLLTNTRDKESLKRMKDDYKLVLEQKALFENHTTRLYSK